MNKKEILLRSTLTIVVVLALAACGSGSGSNAVDGSHNNGGAQTHSYDTNIRTTSFGIPHIKAGDYGSLGYGIGYVQARDNLCVLAQDYLTINGRRAEFFGADGGYSIPAAGSYASNVNSDFFWSSLITQERIDAFREGAGPQAIAASQGFADGYNRYLRELRNGAHPDRQAACRDAAWVRPITLEDMLRRYIRLAVLASSSVFPTEIATAKPPAGPGDILPLPSTQDILDLVNPADLPFPLKIGSNMYGLGPEATQNGQSILFGNPHFPWVGTERLYQMQLTIPGEADIFGGSLYGVPAVLIGFNEHFAWSHTVSTAYRFTFYELKLDPLDPTQYLYNGKYIPMTSKLYTIKVRQDDGSLQEISRRLYRSRFGQMLELSVSGVPILGWSNAVAYSLRDANLENTRLIRQFFAWNKAQSLDEFKSLHASILGVPWVNAIATGPGQPAYYGDLTVVPNVPDAMVARCQSLVSPVFALLMPGLPVLDGSKASCNWRTDEDAPAPGIFGPSHLPTLVRNDDVSNMNDSYWLTNPAEPLTGYAAIIGDEKTERTLRTRLGLKQIQRRLDGSDGLPGTKFNMENLKTIVLDSAIYSAELARNDLVNSPLSPCFLGTALSTTNLVVDVSKACNVLKRWDRKANLDSVGDHIWREFWTRADDGLLPVPLPVDVPPFWLTSFSVTNPVNTPRGLNLANPLISTALGDAVAHINALGIPLDAPMRDIQHSGIHEEFIPIFGDLGDETGSFTVTGGAPLDKTGYPVLRGNSYIQAVTWEPGCTDRGDGCKPIAEGFVTYSQSSDPAIPHYSDETKRYSNKQWIKYLFTEDEIEADPNLVIEQLHE